jgi:hypothetical protein
MKTHDRTKIHSAKEMLPLPDLLAKLGFPPPPGGEGNMQSPFVVGRKQKTLSFSIFKRGEHWGWCDRTGGKEIKGDEIKFLEILEKINTASAIALYLALAGVENGLPAPAVRKAPPVAKKSKPQTGYVLDWPAAGAKFSNDHVDKLAKWRGYPVEFVAWLRDQGLIGLCKDSCAFPVHNEKGEIVAAHIRPKNGHWFYAPRLSGGLRPLFIGDVLTTKQTMLFESQWDAFAVMAALGWHKWTPPGWAVLITRGAANGRFAGRALGAVYAWPQNDQEKDGKRAGEEWMKEAIAHAPGEIYRVETPARFKDANEWAQAEKIDVMATIEQAEKIQKNNVVPFPGNASAAPKAPGENGSNPTPPKPFDPLPAPKPFDPLPVLEEMGLYWLDGSSSYFLHRKENGRVRFLEMGAAEIRRKLRVRGHRSRPDADTGESVAPVDKILDAATEQRAVDFSVNIGGTKAGVYDLAGRRVLVRESPRLIDPAPGTYDVIEAFLFQLLGSDGMEYLCSWLKVAYEALRAGERRPGQALIIIGPPDCGKSRIQHQIITPILAGRSADPKSFFFGRTDFNAELIGAEHLLIEEVPSSSRHEERQFFGERIKEIVANDTARLHKKNRDAVTVSPFWRLSITLNDNIEKLRCLPPLTDDLAEKIIMLTAKQAPEFWARFSESPDPRKAFREAIESQLPAFIHYLTTTPILDSLKGRRYGVKSIMPEEIAQIIFESEPEHHLLLLIDKEIFKPGRLDTGPWTGDAEDLKQTLCDEASLVRPSATRLLAAYPTACGQYLARLEAKFPDRFAKHRTANKRDWIIQPPAT